MMGKIALGVTGVALTTGAVVAAVALSNDKTRNALKKEAKKAAKQGLRKVSQTVRGAIDEGKDRYQAYQHRIGISKGKKRITSRKRG